MQTRHMVQHHVLIQLLALMVRDPQHDDLKASDTTGLRLPASQLALSWAPRALPQHCHHHHHVTH
jgi:hypothetical protein